MVLLVMLPLPPLATIAVVLPVIVLPLTVLTPPSSRMPIAPPLMVLPVIVAAPPVTCTPHAPLGNVNAWPMTVAVPALTRTATPLTAGVHDWFIVSCPDETTQVTLRSKSMPPMVTLVPVPLTIMPYTSSVICIPVPSTGCVALPVAMSSPAYCANCWPQQLPVPPPP